MLHNVPGYDLLRQFEARASRVGELKIGRFSVGKISFSCLPQAG